MGEKMPLIGYARSIVDDESFRDQKNKLIRYGCSIIRGEILSNSPFSGKTELSIILDFIREEDTLIVTRIDRIAQNLNDVVKVLRRLEQNKAKIIFIDHEIDLSKISPGFIADFLETILEAQSIGLGEKIKVSMKDAKARGKIAGRRRTISDDQILDRIREGQGPSQIAKELGISRSTVQKIKRQERASNSRLQNRKL